MPDRLGNEVRLNHIIDAIKEIENYTINAIFDDFLNNSMMFNATVRQLEIVGEAANRLSEDLLLQYKGIPWRQIIGLRNMVIHEYFGIDKELIWNIVKENLPSLKEQILLIMNDLNE